MSMNTILLSVLTNRKKVLVAKVDKNKGGHWNEISSVISNYIYIYIYTQKKPFIAVSVSKAYIQSTATSICHSDTCELQFSFGLSAG